MWPIVKLRATIRRTVRTQNKYATDPTLNSHTTNERRPPLSLLIGIAPAPASSTHHHEAAGAGLTTRSSVSFSLLPSLTKSPIEAGATS